MITPKLLILAILLIPLGLSQTTIGSRTSDIGSRMDFHLSASAVPTPTGTTLPATCVVGDRFFKTDATAGQNDYGCTTTNIWTQLGGTSGGGVTDATIPVSDITTNNCSTTKHGWAPKAPNDATKYLDGTCVFSTPAGSGTGSICTTSRTSGTVVTVASGAGSTTPCILGVGNKAYRFTSSVAATLVANGGTVYVYLSSAGAITFGYGGGTFVGGNVTCSGCTATFGVTAFPIDALPLSIVTATAGAWDTTVTAEKPESSAARKLVAGTNITLTTVADQTTIDSTGGGSSPGGSGTELQYRSSASTFGAVTGSSTSGGNITVVGSVTAGANGRVVMTQGGGGGGGFNLYDAAANGISIEPRNNGVDAATLWLSPSPGTNGVAVWGKGGIQLIPALSGTAPYTCASGTRGLVWVVNSGAGVGDILQICLKGTADTYAWRTVFQAP